MSLIEQAAKRLKITLEDDGRRLDENLKTADVLFGWNFNRKNLAQRAPRLRWIHCDHAGLNKSARPEVFEKGLLKAFEAPVADATGSDES